MPVKFPNGSTYFEQGDYFILANGIHVPNGPDAKADIERFSKVPIKSSGSLLDMDPNLTKGAVPFANGSVYFPQGDFYVLKNGRIIANTKNAGDFIPNAVKMPPYFPDRAIPGDPKVPTPPPGTPPGRPITDPPPPAPTPDRPRPPIPDPVPGFPPGIGPPRDPVTPTPPPSPDNFSKGQVRDALMPDGMFSPTADSVEPFNPYRGAQSTLGVGGADEYDPYGIGAGNYGGEGYDGLGGSATNIYDLTGSNAATGGTGMPKYGIVGGQGGIGVGMVGPEFSGPIFDNVGEALKAMRRQKRLLNEPTVGQANPVPGNPTGIGTKGGQVANTPTTPTTPVTPTGTPPPAGATAAPNSGGGWINGGAAPGSAVMQTAIPGFYDSPFGRLTTASGGNANVYKKEGTSEADGMYYVDPATKQWKQMTQADYQANPTRQYADPQQVNAPGAVQQSYYRLGEDPALKLRGGRWAQGAGASA